MFVHFLVPRISEGVELLYRQEGQDVSLESFLNLFSLSLSLTHTHTHSHSFSWTQNKLAHCPLSLLTLFGIGAAFEAVSTNTQEMK